MRQAESINLDESMQAVQSQMGQSPLAGAGGASGRRSTATGSARRTSRTTTFGGGDGAREEKSGSGAAGGTARPRIQSVYNTMPGAKEADDWVKHADPSTGKPYWYAKE